MNQKGQIVFGPSLLNYLIGNSLYIIIIYIIVYIILVIPISIILGELIIPELDEILITIIVGWILNAIIIHSYNRFIFWTNNIEGPTMWGWNWGREIIEYDEIVKIQSFQNNVLLRILFGDIIISKNNKKIRILWLSNKERERLLSLINNKGSYPTSNNN